MKETIDILKETPKLKAIAEQFNTANTVEHPDYWVSLQDNVLRITLRGTVTVKNVTVVTNVMQSILHRNPGVKFLLLNLTNITDYELAVRPVAHRVFTLCKQYKLSVCAISTHTLANTLAMTVALIVGVKIKILSTHAEAMKTINN